MCGESSVDHFENLEFYFILLKKQATQEYVIDAALFEPIRYRTDNTNSTRTSLLFVH